MITKQVKLWLDERHPVIIKASQFDSLWQFQFEIIYNGLTWTIPSGATAILNGLKFDGTIFSVSGAISGNVITVNCDTQMTAAAGPVICELVIAQNSKRVATTNFIIDVEKAPKSPSDVSSESTLPAYEEILDRIEDLMDATGVNIQVDAELSDDSQNPVQNRTISEALAAKEDIIDTDQVSTYRSKVLEVAASFLARSEFSSSSMTGVHRDGDRKILVYYSNNNTWIAGTFRGGTPTFDDTMEINGTTYNVVYLDCVAFVSLCTSGIDFENSPQKYVMETVNPEQSEIDRLSYENLEVDCTFNFFGNFETFRVFQNLESSHNPPHLIFQENRVGADYIDQAYIDKMESGDLILFGSSYHEETLGRYKGIHHIALYIKDLADLQEYCSRYSVTAKASLEEDDDTSYGYLIEMTDPSDHYTDALRIKTLYSWMHRGTRNDWAHDATWVTTYSVKPKMSFGVSNRQLFNTLHAKLWGNVLSFYNRSDRFSSPTIVIDSYRGNISYRGETISSTIARPVDLDDILTPGLYRTTAASVTRTLIHSPLTTGLLSLLVFTPNEGDGYVTQLMLGYTETTANLRVYMRSKLEDGFTDWINIAGNANAVLPAGGTTGQFLTKLNNNDYAAGWVTVPNANGGSF